LHLGNDVVFEKTLEYDHSILIMCLASGDDDCVDAVDKRSGVSVRKKRCKSLYKKWHNRQCGVLHIRRYEASYTVEATYIMVMVIFALIILIQTAYMQCQETTGSFKLHNMVCQFRGQEREMETSFVVGQSNGSVVRGAKKVEGVLEYKSQEGERKRQEIEVSIHAPEELMRMMTIFQAEEMKDGRDKTDGDQLSPGDEE